MTIDGGAADAEAAGDFAGVAAVEEGEDPLSQLLAVGRGAGGDVGAAAGEFMAHGIAGAFQREGGELWKLGLQVVEHAVDEVGVAEVLVVAHGVTIGGRRGAGAPGWSTGRLLQLLMVPGRRPDRRRR